MRVIVHTPTPDLRTSIAFYRALGFERGGSEERPLFFDSQFEVEVNADRSARPGVRLVQPSWKAELERLDGLTPTLEVEGGHLLADPSNVWIYLSAGDEPAERGKAPCLLGTFAGLSLETTDMERSAAVWGALGFTTDADLSSAWVSAQNDTGFTVTWMRPNNCPHLFFNPSLTFFNSGKNLGVIAGILKAGVEITEEITGFNDQGVVDNVIVRDPGGYGMFVFND